MITPQVWQYTWTDMLMCWLITLQVWQYTRTDAHVLVVHSAGLAVHTDRCPCVGGGRHQELL